MPKKVKSIDLVTTKNVHTLTIFIEENQKLITVLGVFIALTGFSSSLQLKTLGYVLSLLFLTLAVLIWLEIWVKFPSGNATWRLAWFENILSITTLAIIAYWFIEFNTFWHVSLSTLIFFILVNIFSNIMKHFNIFNRLFHTEPGKLKILRIGMGISVIVVLGILALYVSYKISLPMNNVLDTLHNSFQTPVP